MNNCPPIPFLSRIDSQSCQEWLRHLRLAMPNLKIAQLHDYPLSYWNNSEIAVVANPDPNEFDLLPKLNWIQNLWAGVENLVKELPQQISIVRMTDPQLSRTMAQAVLAWSLYLHRDMPLYAQQQRELIWKQHYLPLTSERTVAILGLGNLGTTACNVLKREGFNVIGWSNSLKSINGVRTMTGKDGLKSTLQEADILVLLLPLTALTRGLLGEENLNQMKKGASIINFARAPILDTEAALAQLRNNRLNHLVLDVFNTEPLPKNNQLWVEPNVTVLPHIAAPTNMITASDIVAKNIKKFLKTGSIPKAVNRTTGY